MPRQNSEKPSCWMPGQNREKQGEKNKKKKQRPVVFGDKVKPSSCPLFRCLDKTVHLLTCWYCFQMLILFTRLNSHLVFDAFGMGKKKEETDTHQQIGKSERYQISDVRYHRWRQHALLRLYITRYIRFGAIQRRLVLWPLRKVDTQTWEAFHFFTVTKSKDWIWSFWKKDGFHKLKTNWIPGCK